MSEKMRINLLRRWVRAGAGFTGVGRSHRAPDLEQLLLDTARCAPAEPRLFIMAATWLCRYGSMIAKDRLAAMTHGNLEEDHKAVMGLLLDTVRQATGMRHFNKAIAICAPARDPMPLFEIERTSAALVAIARSRASSISCKWRRWARPIELKPDALRPAWWVIRSNGEPYRLRADLKGDLRLSILLELGGNPESGTSEVALARACGAQRHAIRHALDGLETAGRIRRRGSGRGRRSMITAEVVA